MLKNRSIPFGYCVINGKYALNATEAEAVQQIFKKYIDGKSLKTIAAEMKIPYNSGKSIWNKNMVCRVLENAKYTGENGYPQIVSTDDFRQAARMKAKRNTYRKPIPQAEPQTTEIATTEYKSTDEIQRMTNEINRLIDLNNADRATTEELISKCAELKYAAISEVKM